MSTESFDTQILNALKHVNAELIFFKDNKLTFRVKLHDEEWEVAQVKGDLILLQVSRHIGNLKLTMTSRFPSLKFLRAAFDQLSSSFRLAVSKHDPWRLENQEEHEKWAHR